MRSCFALLAISLALLPACTPVCDTTLYADADGDGFGDPATQQKACPAAGLVTDNSDCDDSDATVNLGAAWHADADGDGYGNSSLEVLVCPNATAPAGYVDSSTDCDDADPAVNTAATEVCDGVDNDCDGLVDDADDNVVGLATWYADADGDGYGDQTVTTVACFQPAGSVYVSGDCDDADSAISPAATEVCDDVDNDCDGLVDDADDSLVATAAYYPDADGDGYGDASASPILACEQPRGTVADNTDCDDTDASASPVGIEVGGDGVDQNCDGVDSFVYETFEGYGEGSPAGSGCWADSTALGYGPDVDSVSSAMAHGGVKSLGGTVDPDSSLFCYASGFESDFSFDGWFYDDGGSDSNSDWLSVAFDTAAAPADPVQDVLLVGYAAPCEFDNVATNYAIFVSGNGGSGCDSGEVAAQVNLGARSVGWHAITASATYLGGGIAHWTVCVDTACAPIDTTEGVVGSFHLRHDNVSGAYWDDFNAYAP